MQGLLPQQIGHSGGAEKTHQEPLQLHHPPVQHPQCDAGGDLLPAVAGQDDLLSHVSQYDRFLAGEVHRHLHSQHHPERADINDFFRGVRRRLPQGGDRTAREHREEVPVHLLLLRRLHHRGLQEDGSGRRLDRHARSSLALEAGKRCTVHKRPLFVRQALQHPELLGPHLPDDDIETKAPKRHNLLGEDLLIPALFVLYGVFDTSGGVP